jgi:hypothetical protein
MTGVLDFWQFVHERQLIYHRREKYAKISAGIGKGRPHRPSKASGPARVGKAGLGQSMGRRGQDVGSTMTCLRNTF